MRRKPRAIEEYRAVAGNANAARSVNDKSRRAYRNVAGGTYAVLRFPRDIDRKATGPRELDIPCSHNAHIVIESNTVLTLKHDVQIACQFRIDAAIAEHICDRRVAQRKSLRVGVVRRHPLAACDSEVIAGELFAVNKQVVLRCLGKRQRRQHRYDKGEC